MNKFVLAFMALAAFGCKKDKSHDSDGCSSSDTDDKQRAAQESILAEANAQVGMPSVKNFRERKLLKDLIELRDQEGLVTYTYLVSNDAKLVFLCQSIGYALPYATQFTNPMKPQNANYAIAQADPNGLFSPADAEGTWVLCSDPLKQDSDVKAVYVEPRIIVSPFRLLPEAATTPEKGNTP